MNIVDIIIVASTIIITIILLVIMICNAFELRRIQREIDVLLKRMKDGE